MHAVSQGRVGRMLDAIGLDTPAARAWAMYDWANSAYATTVAAAVFPIYFVRVAGAGLPEGRAYTIWTLTGWPLPSAPSWVPFWAPWPTGSA